jgi:hypothetical protein
LLLRLEGRGAKPSQRKEAEQLITVLELNNPTSEPMNSNIIYGKWMNSNIIYGKWELLYSSTQLFRSSPFFMARRAVCMTSDQAQQYDWFCDMHRKALVISNIGPVQQNISSTSVIN